MIEQEFLTQMDAYQRMERITQLLDIDSELRRGFFDGIDYLGALAYFEGMYRWAVFGRGRSDFDTTKHRIERAAAEMFGPRSPGHSAVMQVVADVVAYTAKVSYPISMWSREELLSEYRRLDFWRDVYAYVAAGGAVVGGTRTVLGNAALAGVSSAQRIATVIGPAGTIFSGAVLAAGILGKILVERTMAEIEEEVQDVRIPTGQISEEEWNSLFVEMVQN